jgi:hypothetical protein
MKRVCEWVRAVATVATCFHEFFFFCFFLTFRKGVATVAIAPQAIAV